MVSLEVGISRFLLCLSCLILLKLVETWISSSKLDLAPDPGYYIPPPNKNSPKCDACRAIGLMVDSALRQADSRAQSDGEEVTEDELEAIKDEVCSEYTFREIELVVWKGRERLRSRHLETWTEGHMVSQGRNWPQTVANHCRFLVERMKGLELYDLWLRAGHRHPASWIEFLCEGDGVFGDCVESDHTGTEKWLADRDQDKEKSTVMMDRVLHTRK